jgi:hypothetical protein
MSALQTSLLRQEAALLRQLQALERASMHAALRDMQLAEAQDPSLRPQLALLQHLHSRPTPTEARLEVVEHQLRHIESGVTNTNALLDLANLALGLWDAQEDDKVPDARDEPADPHRESQACIICSERKRAVICLPCGHLYACNQCWRGCTNRTPTPTCATCRAPVTHTLQATQHQRDAADAAPTGHAGSADGVVTPGLIYMNAQLPAPLAAMQLCLDRRACCRDHTSV